jgi:hypothetical protein
MTIAVVTPQPEVTVVEVPTVVAVTSSQAAAVAVVQVPTVVEVAGAEAAVVVAAPGPQGPPGPVGPPGSAGGTSGQIRLSATAGVTLSGHRAVTQAPDGTLFYASNTEVGHVHAPIWLTLGAAIAGSSVEVLTYGVVSEPSWSWTPGPLYLGANGLITQVPPTAPGAVFIAQIGVAISPTLVWIDRRSSISLA